MPPIIDMPRLQEIRKKLKELPKIEKVKTFSGPEALKALQKDIRALSRKGYDSKDIAKILKQEGLAVSSAKVKKILVDETPETADKAADEVPETEQIDLGPEPSFISQEDSDDTPESFSPSAVRRRIKPKTNGKEAQQ